MLSPGKLYTLRVSISNMDLYKIINPELKP